MCICEYLVGEEAAPPREPDAADGAFVGPCMAAHAQDVAVDALADWGAGRSEAHGTFHR